MRKLRNIALVAALSVIPVGTAYADGGSPCDPIPGQMNTPPCSTTEILSADDSPQSPATALTPVNETIEYSIADLTLDVVGNVLALF